MRDGREGWAYHTAIFLSSHGALSRQGKQDWTLGSSLVTEPAARGGGDPTNFVCLASSTILLSSGQT